MLQPDQVGSGVAVGLAVGLLVGLAVGLAVGFLVGAGVDVGSGVGVSVGKGVSSGAETGSKVGSSVGIAVISGAEVTFGVDVETGEAVVSTTVTAACLFLQLQFLQKIRIRTTIITKSKLNPSRIYLRSVGFVFLLGSVPESAFLATVESIDTTFASSFAWEAFFALFFSELSMLIVRFSSCESEETFTVPDASADSN